jgi:Zn-finger protein
MEGIATAVAELLSHQNSLCSALHYSIEIRRDRSRSSMGNAIYKCRSTHLAHPEQSSESLLVQLLPTNHFHGDTVAQ